MSPGSEHKDPRMQCNPLYFRYTFWLFCNPEPPLWPRQQYVAHLLPRRALWPQVQSVILRYTFHCALGSVWATNHSCIWTLTLQVQSVILPLYLLLRFGIHVGHESPCHLKRAAKLEHVCYGIGAEKQKLLGKLRCLYLAILTVEN